MRSIRVGWLSKSQRAVNPRGPPPPGRGEEADDDAADPKRGGTEVYDPGGDDAEDDDVMPLSIHSIAARAKTAVAGVPVALSAPGSRVKLEWPVNHKYEYFDAYVTRLPLFNPERRTA